MKKQTKQTEGKNKNNDLRIPKGMRDLTGKTFFEYQGFFEKAAEIAIYYGFTPIETPIVEYEDVFVRAAGESSDIIEKEIYSMKTKGGDKLALRPEFTAGTMRAYIEHGMQSEPQPVMLYSHGPVFRHDKPQAGRYRDPRQFNIEVIGSEKSIADAMVIHLVMTILKEIGLENLTLEVNSIGDKECRNNYKRELVNYYKKHLGELCKDCHRRLKENPLRLLDCKVCVTVKEHAPSSIAHLCEGCKKHFKEVLEYLEALSIPYMVNPTIVRGLDYYTRTVFEVMPQVAPKIATNEGDTNNEDAETSQPLTIASGGRYDYLGKDLGSNKPIPSVGAAIGVDRTLLLPRSFELVPRIVKKPKVFFIQLGFEAKLKSLSVVEILRQAKIPVLHSLSKDSLTAQLGAAEKLNIPYTIILGQKEVIEESVIVRDMSNRSQKSVSINKLADYLKKLK